MTRRVAGLVLIALTGLPLYRFAGAAGTGLAGRATVERLSTQAAFLWSGTLVLGLVALLASLLLASGFGDRALGRMAAVIRRPADPLFAAGVGLLAFATTAAFTVGVLDGRPTLIDAMVQLVQGRYLAAGRLTGPALDDPAFWFVQNTLLTGGGWASQYPPGHAALLAVGFRLGAVALVPALLAAVTASFSYVVFRRILPGRELVARVAALGVAVSPFLVAQTGSFMSHGSATALSVVAVYFALRARDGRAAWSPAAGVVLGLLLATRPLVALVIGLGVVLPLGLAAVRAGLLTRSGLGIRLAGALLAAALPAALWLAYNARVFGGPLELGYVQAWGSAHGLGFGRDPWGNVYTPLVALGYTSADLTALGLALFEIPLPLVALVGLWLVAARRLETGAGVLAAWGLLPVVTGFFYWHHSYGMGPRMLAEAVPAWVALVVLAAAWAWRRADGLHALNRRVRARDVLAGLAVAAAVAALYLAPLRLRAYGVESAELRLDPPAPPGPALVFVHGGWTDRVYARLAAAGLPPHAVETAVRQNDLCRLERALSTAPLDAGELDLEPRARAPGVVDVEVFEGVTIALDRLRLRPDGGLDLPERCMAQLRADRFGALGLAPLLWRGGLPGIGGAGDVIRVRDLGPDRNQRLRQRYPDRPHFVLLRDRQAGTLHLIPYDEGVARLWSPPTFP